MPIVRHLCQSGLSLALCLLAFTASPLQAQTKAAPLPENVTAIPDIPFAEVPGRTLMINLFLPKDVKNPPLVVNIHGGGWKAGSRKSARLAVAAKGYALASIDYRYSSEAVFPAQIYDCKGAIRWLRAHAKEYGYDASFIAVMGDSAGGHLAVLLGTTNNDKSLEGDVGGNLDQSSAVQCIVDSYGPADFILRSKDQPEQTEKKGGKVYDLLGGPVAENLEKAKLASGAWHVTPAAPPLLIFHGTADTTVFINQSERLLQAYKDAGLSATLQKVKGGGHGGPQFNSPENLDLMIRFLDSHLRQGKPAADTPGK
jgi:acetyl esterase/lipase